MPGKLGLILGLILGQGLALGGGNEEVRADRAVQVAAATSLREALTAIAADYEKEHATKVEITWGSSGQLLAQIRNGAEFDIFISAAQAQIDVLEQDKLVVEGSRHIVAANRLVLIAPADAEDPPDSFEALSQPTIRRVAIGEPATVPAGMYAQQVFDTLKLNEALKDKFVFGKNVRHVLDYVRHGEVSAGVVYASDARAESRNVRVCAEADPSWHEPIIYPAVRLQPGKHAEPARAFLEYLAEDGAKATLQSFGLTAAPTSPDADPRPSPAPATPREDGDPAGTVS